jgi:hypothetical protein
MLHSHQREDISSLENPQLSRFLPETVTFTHSTSFMQPQDRGLILRGSFSIVFKTLD